MIYQKFSKRQLLAMLWWQQPKFKGRDALICDGSIRSGKSLCMAVGFILWSMAEFNGQNFAFCGKTIQSLRRNVILNLRNWVPDDFEIVEHRTENKLVVSNKTGRENTYYLFGGRDESSYMLIQGITLAGVLLDEVALQPKSFVEQAIGRCSIEGSKFWFNCNPAGPSHWFYKEWVEGDKPKEKNALHVHFTMDDNPSLPPKIKARYEGMFSGVFYDRYVRGLWVAADGLVYPYFANHTEEFLIDNPVEWCRAHGKRFYKIMIGVDFGGTKSHTAFKAVGITYDWYVVVLDEEHMDSVGLDPDKLNKKFCEFVRRVQEAYGRSQTRADNEESVLIRGLQNAVKREGLLTTVLNAIKMQINDRIKLTTMLMAQKRLFVARKCVHMIDAFQTAIYDPDKFEDVRLDDGTSDIDSLDAWEYCLEPWYNQLIKAVERAS